MRCQRRRFLLPNLIFLISKKGGTPFLPDLSQYVGAGQKNSNELAFEPVSTLWHSSEEEAAATITTAEDSQPKQTLQSRNVIGPFIQRRVPPPQFPRFPRNPPNPFSDRHPYAEVGQFAQSPRRKERTAHSFPSPYGAPTATATGGPL